MESLLTFSVLIVFQILFGLSLQQNDDMDAPAKSAVVQHPVTVNVQRPQPMTTQPPSAALKTRVVVVHNNMVPVPIECFQPPDSGTCSKDLARVYYDHETRTCKPFSYTGCGGNANRFQSIKNCYRICHPYRYKIRPKVVNKDKANKGMKVRVLPPKQTASMDPSMQGGMGGPQMRSGPSPYGQPGMQQQPYGQQPGGYGQPQMAPPFPGYAQQQSSGYGYGGQQFGQNNQVSG